MFRYDKILKWELYSLFVLRRHNIQFVLKLGGIFEEHVGHHVMMFALTIFQSMIDAIWSVTLSSQSLFRTLKINSCDELQFKFKSIDYSLFILKLR